jgi:hypothetical protein
MMSVEQPVETEVLEENLLQCCFVHHKSNMTWATVVGSQQLTA